jgi:hypothetical protein
MKIAVVDSTAAAPNAAAYPRARLEPGLSVKGQPELAKGLAVRTWRVDLYARDPHSPPRDGEGGTIDDAMGYHGLVVPSYTPCFCRSSIP